MSQKMITKMITKMVTNLNVLNVEKYTNFAAVYQGIKKNVLITPTISDSGISGVMRQGVIDEGKRFFDEVIEAMIYNNKEIVLPFKMGMICIRNYEQKVKVLGLVKVEDLSHC